MRKHTSRVPPPQLAAFVAPVAVPVSMWWLFGALGRRLPRTLAYNLGLVMFDLIPPLKSAHIRLQAPLGLQEGVLAIWLLAKGFAVSALASVAPAGGSGGSS